LGPSLSRLAWRNSNANGTPSEDHPKRRVRRDRLLSPDAGKWLSKSQAPGRNLLDIGFHFRRVRRVLKGGSRRTGTSRTRQRLRDVQALIDEGESEYDIARFIAGHDDFTQAEKVLARVVLQRHGLARGS
jgi:hypothetical protein